MHIHGSQRNPGAVSLYAAVAAEKSAAAQKAAEVRKKLVRSASKIDGELDAGRISVNGRGPEEDSEEQAQKHSPALKNKKKQLTDEERSGEAISMWA